MCVFRGRCDGVGGGWVHGLAGTRTPTEGSSAIPMPPPPLLWLPLLLLLPPVGVAGTSMSTRWSSSLPSRRKVRYLDGDD
jgi:hypothetical protein